MRIFEFTRPGRRLLVFKGKIKGTRNQAVARIADRTASL